MGGAWVCVNGHVPTVAIVVVITLVWPSVLVLVVVVESPEPALAALAALTLVINGRVIFIVMLVAAA